MVTGDTRRIVVIKNISSNLIEEAILILKCEPGAQNGDDSAKPVNGKVGADNEFLFREAEAIINNYIRENKLPITPNRRGRRKIGILSNKLFANTLVNFVLLGSIAFLIFVLVRLF